MSKKILLKHWLKTNFIAFKGYNQNIKNIELDNEIEIDFVVTWVNGNDPAWQKKKDNYYNTNATQKKGNTSARYREWDQFQYWFRAVEKYAPWVHKVFLITEGHIPEWINLNSEKLVHIKHSDYMPDKYLPVFNSVPIELCIHNITDLSEHFVLFCDDMFLSAPVNKSDFFKNNYPCYCSISQQLKNDTYNGPFAHQCFSVLGVANQYNWCQSIEQHCEKWYSKEYSFEDLINQKKVYFDGYLPGMYFSHLPVPYRKSTIKKLWDLHYEQFNETCIHKFRTPMDIMHQIFSIYEINQGTYYPVSKKHYGKAFHTLSTQINEISEAIKNQKYKTICLNDSIDVTEDNFEEIKNNINQILNEALPSKSSFEL